jgi:hypothetical protein
VTGFLDEQSIQNWLATEHRDHWLTMRGYLGRYRVKADVTLLPNSDESDLDRLRFAREFVRHTHDRQLCARSGLSQIG